MKVSGYNAKCMAHIVYQEGKALHDIPIKDRWLDKPATVCAALNMANRRVCVLNARGGIIVMNKELQRQLVLDGYDVPEEVVVS